MHGCLFWLTQIKKSCNMLLPTQKCSQDKCFSSSQCWRVLEFHKEQPLNGSFAFSIEQWHTRVVNWPSEKFTQTYFSSYLISFKQLIITSDGCAILCLATAHWLGEEPSPWWDQAVTLKMCHWISMWAPAFSLLPSPTTTLGASCAARHDQAAFMVRPNVFVP